MWAQLRTTHIYILDATYRRHVLSWNRIFGCSYFVRVLNKTWTSSYKWFRVLNNSWNTSAHACHMRDDNNKSSFCWPVTQANKMASQSASKTPTKQRNSWTLVEEKNLFPDAFVNRFVQFITKQLTDILFTNPFSLALNLVRNINHRCKQPHVTKAWRHGKHRYTGIKSFSFLCGV